MDMIWIGFVNIRFHVFSAVHTYKKQNGFEYGFTKKIHQIDLTSSRPDTGPLNKHLIQQYASKHISPFDSQSLNRQNDYEDEEREDKASKSFSKCILAVHSVPADLTADGAIWGTEFTYRTMWSVWRRLNVLVQLLEYHPNHTEASKLTRRE